jgi:hypothetical protein
VSYKTNSTWRALHIGAPFYDNISEIRGDPGIAVTDNGTFWRAFVYSLATSDTRWTSFAQGNNCIAQSLADQIEPDKACVQIVDIPKDGSAATGGLAACFGADDAEDVDGGSIYITPTHLNLYAALWRDPNTTNERIDVYKNYTLLANPFPGKTMEGHPYFVKKSGDQPALIAPDSTRRFWFTSFNETSGSWSTPAQIASGFYWGAVVVLQNGKHIRSRGYTAAWSPFSLAIGIPQLYFFYRKPRDTFANVTRIQGVGCTFLTPNSPTCGPVTNWITPAQRNAVVPAVTVATVNGVEHNWLSYWDDQFSASGNLTLTFAQFGNDGSFTPSATSATQQPCLMSAFDYWGDYDDMVVTNDGTASPSLARFVTDSTGATCNSTDGIPQHVSRVNKTP